MALGIFLLAQGLMGLEIAKRYSSYNFHLMTANFMRTLVTMGEYSLLLVLAIGLVLKISCDFV